MGIRNNIFTLSKYVYNFFSGIRSRVIAYHWNGAVIFQNPSRVRRSQRSYDNKLSVHHSCDPQSFIPELKRVETICQSDYRYRCNSRSSDWVHCMAFDRE